MLLLVVFCCFILIALEPSNATHKINHKEECKWNQPLNSPEVYYINLDRSLQRKINTEKHLNEVGLKYHRVSGLLPKQMIIPDDIENSWRTAWCRTQTSWIPPHRNEVLKNKYSPYYNKTVIIAGLCGRGKNKNTPKELGCTTSHLLAMRRAIYSNSTNSKYALIIEDDVTFPFTIDYDELVKTAPPDFGILQLFNSNKETMKDSWLYYQKNSETNLWIESKNLKFWSTCGYLINRQVMKDVIDQIIYEKDGWLYMKVIAGIQGPCAPKECCDINSQFQVKPPCVWASFGYQADSFLYAMTKTYMLQVPLITNGKGVDASTFHQEHVEMFHKSAFKRQRQYINEMLIGKVKSPSFAVPACKSLNITLN